MDTRPLFMGSDPMQAIGYCNNCGYCAYDISEETDVTEEDLRSPEYREIIRKPNLVNIYAAMAFLALRKGDHSAASNRYLRAAWMADDLGDADASKRMRLACADELGKVECGTELLIVLSDVLRCVGRFEDAAEALGRAKESDAGCDLAEVIEKEGDLIADRDPEPAVCWRWQVPDTEM